MNKVSAIFSALFLLFPYGCYADIFDSHEIVAVDNLQKLIKTHHVKIMHIYGEAFCCDSVRLLKNAGVKKIYIAHDVPQQDNFFDLIYVGNHDEISHDLLNACFSCVSPGGIMCGYGYADFFHQVIIDDWQQKKSVQVNVKEDFSGFWWVKKPHKISFIIPCYNRAHTVRRAIDSVYKQNLNIPFEVVCTDDASTDNTRGVLLEYQNKYSNFKVCLHEKNKGASEARNTAIANSDGDLLFALDSDNFLVPDTVGRLVDLIDSTGCDIASFKYMRYFKDTLDNSYWGYMYKGKENVCGIREIMEGKVTPIPSGNYLFTRKSYDRAGGYQGRVSETWTFGFRQCATGAKIAILSGKEGNFYWHADSVTDSKWRQNHKLGLNDPVKVGQIGRYKDIFIPGTELLIKTYNTKARNFDDDLRKRYFTLIPDEALQYLFDAYWYEEHEFEQEASDLYQKVKHYGVSVSAELKDPVSYITSKNDLTRKLNKGWYVAAVGCNNVKFLGSILKYICPRHFYMVDCLGIYNEQDSEKNKLINAFADQQNTTVMKEKSGDAVDLFEDYLFYWVHIDNGTSYNLVRDCLEQWFSKVQYGGVISGDNYSKAYPGVVRAVNEFLDKYELKIEYLTHDEHKTYVIKKMVKDPFVHTPCLKHHDSKETIEKIVEIITSKKKGAFFRFGDGDLYLARGEKDILQTQSAKLTLEMREAFSLNEPNCLKSLPLPCMDFSGDVKHEKTKSLKTTVEWCSNILVRAKRFWGAEITDIYNPWVLPIVVLTDPGTCISFLHLLKSNNCILVGNEKTPRALIDLLFGGHCKFVSTPSENSYSQIDRIENECLEKIEGDKRYTIIITSMGCSGRVLQKRLWKKLDNVFFFDFGSLMDALCGWSTRNWIRFGNFDRKKFIADIKSFAETVRVEHMKNVAPDFIFYDTRETLITIAKAILSKKTGAYLRFGDGDLLLASGKNDGYQRKSVALASEMRDVLALNGPGIIKGLPLHCKEFSRDAEDMCGGFGVSIKTCGRFLDMAQKFWGGPLKDVYSAWALPFCAYKYQEFAIEFLKILKENNCCLLVGNKDIPSHIRELLFGKDCQFVPTPSKNSYDEIDRIEKACLEKIPNDGKYKIIITSMGCSGRVLQKRLLQKVDNVFLFDFGSLMDILCGWETRAWMEYSNFDAEQFIAMLES